MMTLESDMVVDLIAWSLVLGVWFLAFIAGLFWVVDTVITWRKDLK